MKYYCIKQHDITDCAAACLATVSKQYGLNISIAKIRELAGTDNNGTNVHGIIKAAEQLGFSVKALKGTFKSIFSKFPMPAIAHINNNGILHFIVIHKVTKSYILVADPANGLIKVSFEEFKNAWTGILIVIVPNEKFKNIKSSNNSLVNFFNLLLPHKKLIVEVIVASAIVNGLGIIAALYFQIVIDDVVGAGILNTLHVVSIGIIIVNVFSAILVFVRTQILVYLGQKLDISLLFGYYEHVINLPLSFFGKRKIGEVISRFQDASAIKNTIANTVIVLFINLLMTIVGAILLFIKSKTLFLISVIMVFLYAILVILFNKPIKKANEEQMNDNASLNSYFIESLNGITTIKSYNAEKNTELEAEFKFVKLLKSIFKISSTLNFQNFFKTIVNMVGGIIIIWLGSYFVINGMMTIGGLISFNALLVYFVDPLKNIIDLQAGLQASIVAADRLSEILDLDVEKNENEFRKIKNLNLIQNIYFENINFQYGTRDLILKNLNFSIDAKSTIAIVGESGSGKSTIAKLMLKFYNLEQGDIKIGDFSINEIQLDLLREKISLVTQDTFIFSASIYDNLVYGNKIANYSEILKISKLMKVHDFVCKLKFRYETKLDEGGTNLSGGQKQRIAIARALLKKPEILILDEATSNMDILIEKEIINNIKNEYKDITIIIISHKLEIAKLCDKIFVLKDGTIIESGNHFELLNINNGFYKKIFKMQEF